MVKGQYYCQQTIILEKKNIILSLAFPIMVLNNKLLNPQPVTPVIGVTGKCYGCQRASTSKSIHRACHMLCQ